MPNAPEGDTALMSRGLQPAVRRTNCPGDGSMTTVEHEESSIEMPTRLNKHNPFVGTFNHAKHQQQSPSPSPITGIQRQKSGLRRSVSEASFAALEDDEPETIPFGDHTLLRKCLEFQQHIPDSPELCGFQAIVPKQAGLRVVNKIGEGSFGKVVLAMNRKNAYEWEGSNGAKRHLIAYPKEGQALVLKCVEREEAHVGTILDAVEREIRIHAKCQHPNIAPFFGFYEQAATHVLLILGHVPGRELHDLLRENVRLGESQTVPIFLQVVQAVQYMHSISVVHRDIKPRNVLVSAEDPPAAVLIDLGLAIDLSDNKDREASEQLGIVGTLGYLAPEVMLEHGMVVAACPHDMWALGVLLYETVFGFQPFQAHEICLPGEVEFPDAAWGMSASEQCEALLRGLLEKNGETRITADGAVAHEWLRPLREAQAHNQPGTLAPDGTQPGGVAVPHPEKVAQQDGTEGSAAGPVDGQPPVGEDFLRLKLEVDVAGAAEVEWSGLYHSQRYNASVVMVDDSQCAPSVPALEEEGNEVGGDS